MEQFINNGRKIGIIEKYNQLISNEKNYFKKLLLMFRKDYELRNLKESKSNY
uniref:hypothetical protein n=1 Tax=Flavobacterium sp. TaxID=239 RepID=UPI00404ABFBB